MNQIASFVKRFAGNSRSDSFSLVQISSAGLAFALVLRRYFYDSGIRIPLWTFWPIPIESWIMTIAFIVFALGIVVLKSSKYLNLIAAVSLFVVWSISYSNMGAFSLPLVYLNLFAFAAAGESIENQKSLAFEFLGLVFLISAMQKLNANYLSGIEFSAVGDFSIFLRIWGFYSEASVNPLKVEWIRVAVAFGSVGVEAFIGIGLILRSVKAAHLVMIFVALLSLLHPPVLFVGLFFFALVCLVDPEFFIGLKEWRGFKVFFGAATWVVIAFVFNHWLMKSLAEASGIIGAIGMLSLHLRRIRQLGAKGKCSFQIKGNFKFARNWRSGLVPFLLLISGLWGRLGAPSPIGFTMFSGQRFGHIERSYKIEMFGTEVCQVFSMKMKRTVISDVFVKDLNGSCQLYIPTIAGVNYALYLACRKTNEATWRLSESMANLPKTCRDVEL